MSFSSIILITVVHMVIENTGLYGKGVQIALACVCTHHIKNMPVIHCMPKTFDGVLIPIYP